MLKTSASGARRIVVSALVALAVCLAVPGNALAQSGQDAAQGTYDEATIDKFVQAARQVVALRKQYEHRLEAAPTKEAAQKLVDEARVLMSAAIAGAGFTDAEYMEIARTAQADPTLRARLEALVGSP